MLKAGRLIASGPKNFAFRGRRELRFTIYLRWDGAATANDYWFRAHPVIPAVGPLLRIPIGLHGDDAGAHGQEQVFTFTWGSLAAALPTLDSRIIFTMMKVSSMAESTMPSLLAVLSWSLAALSSGFFPRVDHMGRAFGPDHHPKRAALAGKSLAGG